jgi:hypothetical protein
LDRVLPPGLPTPQVYLTLARNAGLFKHMVDSGLLGPTGLMDRGSIDSALRELLILRTCVATRNDYEFNLHVSTISEQMGLTHAQIEAVRQPSPTEGVWSATQVALMLLVDALVTRLDVTDEEFAIAREHFDDATGFTCLPRWWRHWRAPRWTSTSGLAETCTPSRVRLRAYESLRQTH